MRDLARRVTEGGARLVTLTDSPSGALGHCVAVETGLPEPLTPFVFTVAGQLLALLMAEALGIDSDGPRGLRKVTETR
jgi:glucosamine 6-phosphate synthetase-like amidotransferase/phosphosugar isomerase protein